MAAKDTLTKKYYEECRAEVLRESGRKWNKASEETNVEDAKLKPIRNIFKMSRVLVTEDEKKKEKNQRKQAALLEDKDGAVETASGGKSNIYDPSSNLPDSGSGEDSEEDILTHIDGGHKK